MKRNVVSIGVAVSFLILAGSGFVAFFVGYDEANMFIHVLFGWLFVLGALIHFGNNVKPLRSYVSRLGSWAVPALSLAILISVLLSLKPMEAVANWYRSYKSQLPREMGEEFETYVFSLQDSNLEVEVKAGPHFWYPQLAIWVEDAQGSFVETLFVTHSTGNDDFYGGRTRENFKDLDKNETASVSRVEVNALPYWSGQSEMMNLDGVSGATPSGNFKLQSKTEEEQFRILLEVNVAFDENEFYSEYDFPDDSVYHGGTGQLGQPSLIYEAVVSRRPGQRYYLMQLIGHGHHSGQTNKLYTDLSGVTTAKQVLDRVLVRIDPISVK